MKEWCYIPFPRMPSWLVEEQVILVCIEDYEPYSLISKGSQRSPSERLKIFTGLEKHTIAENLNLPMLTITKYALNASHQPE